jgi:5-formyltetrahydrofolate cyclo-ligase
MKSNATSARTRPAIRTLMRRRRRALGAGAQQHASRALCRRISRHPWFLLAKSVAAYIAQDGEIDPAPLLKLAQRAGKTGYLPTFRTLDGSMGFRPINRMLVPGRFGIPEPLPVGPSRHAGKIDLILTPIVAFDASGNRLGMGGGYYDGTLTAVRDSCRSPRVLGIAHGIQEVPALDAESWDIPMTAIATDRGWIPATGSRRSRL